MEVHQVQRQTLATNRYRVHEAGWFVKARTLWLRAVHRWLG